MLLSYAKSETRAGVSIIHDGSTVRVIAPAVGGWRLLCRPQLWGASYFLGIAMWGFGQGERFGILCPFAIGAYLAWRQMDLLRSRRIFEVTHQTVRVGRVRGMEPVWHESWPRNAVGDIRINKFNGDLLIQITGHDLKTYFISNDRKTAENVAAALREGLAISLSRVPVARSTIGQEVSA